MDGLGRRALARALGVAAAATLIGWAAAPSSAQQLKKGSLSGTILSFSASTAGMSSTPVTTLPATGRFVLTQICASDGPATVEGLTSFGVIYVASGSGDGCTRFQPGISLPASEQIGFSNGAVAAATVTLTGVLSKK